MRNNVIDAFELRNLIDQDSVIILDCRRERNEERIEGAQFVDFEIELTGQIIKGITGRHPLPRIDEFVKTCRKWGIGNDQQVVVYDESTGAWASRLWWMLRWLGHDSVAVLNGGWNYWKAQDFPISEKPKVHPESDFIPSENKDWIATRSDVIQAQNNNKQMIVDARAAKRYRGEHEPIDPVAGHIPTAINLPFVENMNESGLWREKIEIKQRFEPVMNSDKENRTIMYCGSGVTACHNILATQFAELPIPRLYVGSWSDWINTLQ
ncbi:MAG: sulfurtransferase [Bacteroidia bacterium]|nr:sulfurtransferase [Bacteroidia bacterium]